jgi:hypothetical protein
MLKNKIMPKFKAKICACCGQSEEYLLGLDKGSAKIVIAILKAITLKGINEIHPAQEMDLTGNKKWFLTNLSRPRFHGLIAYIDDKPGYYCLTKKAGKFLRGEAVQQYAIISKTTGHQIGYWGNDTVTIKDLLSDETPMRAGAEDKMISRLYQPEKEGQQALFTTKFLNIKKDEQV